MSWMWRVGASISRVTKGEKEEQQHAWSRRKSDKEDKPEEVF